MTAPRLWHSLALKFRAINDPDNRLLARWKHPSGSPLDTRWEIGGEASAEERTQLLLLCKFSGSRIAPDSNDPLRIWLNKLKSTRPAHEIETRTFEGVDGRLISWEFGTIRELRNACANLCEQFELVSMVSSIHPEVANSDAKKPVREPIGDQIKRLREECRWTVEDLAEKIDMDERTVRRHEVGGTTPYGRTIASYERVFSNKLERKIVIKQLS